MHPICFEFTMTGGKMVNYEIFEISLKRLQEQTNNYQTLDENYPKFINCGIAESVVQRFETCYDTLWKVLWRHLIEILAIPDVPNSPKTIFRMANENNLLKSPVEQWFKYAQARIDTSHDYDGEKAKACLQLIPEFLIDAVVLLGVLRGEEWE